MKTLLLIDIQNDFLPGGALAVTGGDVVVPVANRRMPAYDLVVATQDWHPADHQSFASQHPWSNIGDVVDLDGLDQILERRRSPQQPPASILRHEAQIGVTLTGPVKTGEVLVQA